ncbi:MAG: ethylbenzene dehydrogenase-related protein, partial [Dehalococcoidia bacterium]
MDETLSNRPAPAPERSPLNRRTFTQAAIGVAAVAGAAGLAGWSAVRHAEHGHFEPAQTTRRILAARVADAVPRDPAAPAWKAIEALDVPLVQQYMVAPRLQPEGMIPKLTLRTMHNGREIGFHVSWGDSNSSDVEAVARFRDSVAVQLPVDPDAPVGVVMGQPGRPVHLLHWRASWQRTVKNGPRTVRDAFPRVINDIAPDNIMKPEQARAYYPALMVGNTMAARQRTSP